MNRTSFSTLLSALSAASLIGLAGCGGGTSGSTPIGGERAFSMRVQVVSSSGEIVPDQMVELVGASQSDSTNPSGFVTFEVREEEQSSLALGLEGSVERVSLVPPPEGTTFVGAIIERGEEGIKLLKQVEMSVEAEGPCREFLERRDGIDFYLQKDFSGSVDCLFDVVETEQGRVNPNLKSWKAGIACADTQPRGLSTPADLGVTAGVKSDGSAVMLLPLEEERKGCEVILSREFEEVPSVMPQRDVFNPRVVLQEEESQG